MRIDQLDGLVAFRCVAEAKSFTAAAARLEVSPQAISQAVKSLESRLGVRLFHRTTPARVKVVVASIMQPSAEYAARWQPSC